MPSAIKRPTFLLLAAIITLAVFFRFYQITEIPPGLWPDEAANGVNAVHALETGDFKIFYPDNNGREGMFINIQALAVKIFGAEAWSLRIVSALFGTLTVLGLYLMTKELLRNKSEERSTSHKPQISSNDQNSKRFGIWNLGFGISRGELIGLLSAFFLAVSFWHVNFSRIGFRAISVPFFAVFGIYWLMKSLRTGKISSAVLGGIFTGLGFHTYIAFRFIPFIIAVPIIIAFLDWLKGRKKETCVPCIVALFLFVTFIVALPIGLYFLEHPEDFASRSGPISIFAAKSPLLELAKSSIITLGMFNVVGDCNPRHNFFCRSELYWPVGILFVIGLVLTIRHLAKKEPDHTLIPRRSAWTLIAWFLFMALPSVLTREGLPHALRVIGMIPPVFVFTGIGGWWLWDWVNRKFVGRLEKFVENNEANHFLRGKLRRIKREVALFFFVFLIWIGANEGITYFIRWAPTPEVARAFEQTKTDLARYILTIPPEVPVYVVVNEPSLLVDGISLNAQPVVFLTSARPKTFFASSDNLDAIPPRLDRAIIVALHTDRELLSELLQRHPNGMAKTAAWDIVPFIIPR